MFLLRQMLNRNSPQRILQTAVRPLFSKDHNLALFFSAKAGCTFALKWFFFHTNYLDEALAYHPWIHEYRLNVFYKLPEYKKNIHEILNEQTNTIKIVRDPYARAVSSYIHAARCGYENEKLSHFLNRKVDKERGFSFREFVSYLGSIDLRRCNPHHRVQIHLSEEKGLVIPNYIVKLENSLDDFKQIETELGLRESDLVFLNHSGHHVPKNEENTFSGDIPYSVHSTKGLSFPSYIKFYDDHLKKEIARLYQIDFDTYGYEINHP